MLHKDANDTPSQQTQGAFAHNSHNTHHLLYAQLEIASHTRKLCCILPTKPSASASLSLSGATQCFATQFNHHPAKFYGSLGKFKHPCNATRKSVVLVCITCSSTNLNRIICFHHFLVLFRSVHYDRLFCFHDCGFLICFVLIIVPYFCDFR